MTIQQLVEDFENDLWNGRNPNLIEWVKKAPKEKQSGLYLILDCLKDFYDEANLIQNILSTSTYSIKQTKIYRILE